MHDSFANRTSKTDALFVDVFEGQSCAPAKHEHETDGRHLVALPSVLRSAHVDRQSWYRRSRIYVNACVLLRCRLRSGRRVVCQLLLPGEIRGKTRVVLFFH